MSISGDAQNVNINNGNLVITSDVMKVRTPTLQFNDNSIMTTAPGLNQVTAFGNVTSNSITVGSVTATGNFIGDGSLLTGVTLNTVVNRGNVTANSITVGGLTVGANVVINDTASNVLYVNGGIQNLALQSNGIIYVGAGNVLTTNLASLSFDPVSHILHVDETGGLDARVVTPGLFPQTTVKGQPVYLQENVGGVRHMHLADNDSAGLYPAVGLALYNYAANDNGYVVTNGTLLDLNIPSTFVEGSLTSGSNGDVGKVVYLSATPGFLTITRPRLASNAVQTMGIIAQVTGNKVDILVRCLGRVEDNPNGINAQTANIWGSAIIGGGALQTSTNLYVTGNVYLAGVPNASNALTVNGNVSAGNFYGNAALLNMVTDATPGTYGNGVAIPTITVSSNGRVTSVTSTPFNQVSTGTQNQVGYYSSSNTVSGSTGLTYNPSNSTLTVGGNLNVGGDLTISGTTYSSNNVVFNDTILLVSNTSSNAATRGLLMQRPAGNVMMAYLSSEAGGAYTNTLVLGYTFGNANGPLLTPDTSNSLSVLTTGTFTATGGLYGSSLVVNGGTITGNPDSALGLITTDSTRLQLNANTSTSGQGAFGLALGYKAGSYNQGTYSVAAGFSAGLASQGDQSVAVGINCGVTNQGYRSIAIGSVAGFTSQGSNAIAIGSSTGGATQGSGSVAIGFNAGNSSQGSNAVAIGYHAGSTAGQGSNAVAVGSYAGYSNQGSGSVAIGDLAGQNGQTSNSVAIGVSAGQSAQQTSGIAIGTFAGQTAQQAFGVSIGYNAGNTSQQLYSVGIGFGSALNSQGSRSVALGISAGNTSQSSNAVAIGAIAGFSLQSSNAVAIGSYAGTTNQGISAVALGDLAGQTSQGLSAVAIGDTAGNISQGLSAVAIGDTAGKTSQNNYAVSVGVSAGSNVQGIFAVGVGAYAGSQSQNAYAISVGTNAGRTYQGSNTVAIGYNAAYNTQGTCSVAIGQSAGTFSQGVNAVAVGNYAGAAAGQGSNAVAMGSYAGYTNQGDYCVAIGDLAGQISQNVFAIAIGSNAGQVGQYNRAVAIGTNAGQLNQGLYSIALGDLAGQFGQNTFSVAIGSNAGQSGQNGRAVAIGAYSGQITQGSYGVALGYNSGSNNQGNSAVSLGYNSGVTSQGASSVAVGNQAGQTAQGIQSTAIGNVAGASNQGNYATAIGNSCGTSIQKSYATALGHNSANSNQGIYGTAVGTNAGQVSQGSYAVAIGANAGSNAQAAYAISIGYLAGDAYQSSNSIVLNATGVDMSPATTGFFVQPVRLNGTAVSNVMVYRGGGAETGNPRGEIQYTNWFLDGSGNLNLGGKGILGTGTITPNVNNTSNIGSSSLRYVTIYATNGTISTSDENLKNHVPLRYGLKEILEIDTIQYSWKEGPDQTTQYYGVKAHQISNVLPEIVYDSGPGEPLMINYSEIIPVCMNAIKELATKEFSGTGTLTDTNIQEVIVPKAAHFTSPIIHVTPIYSGTIRALNVGPWDPVTTSFTVYGRPGDFYWTLKDGAAN